MYECIVGYVEICLFVWLVDHFLWNLNVVMAINLFGHDYLSLCSRNHFSLP